MRQALPQDRAEDGRSRYAGGEGQDQNPMETARCSLSSAPGRILPHSGERPRYIKERAGARGKAGLPRCSAAIWELGGL